MRGSRVVRRGQSSAGEQSSKRRGQRSPGYGEVGRGSGDSVSNGSRGAPGGDPDRCGGNKYNSRNNVLRDSHSESSNEGDQYRSIDRYDNGAYQNDWRSARRRGRGGLRGAPRRCNYNQKPVH